MKIAFVMGDREAPESGIAKVCADWHKALGYTVVIGSSWPESELARIYDGVNADVIASVDHLVPFDPKQGHAHRQLHRRIALAVRLGGAALAFARTDVDAVVLGDSDVLMLRGPGYLTNLLAESGDVYTQTLYSRPEAPDLWLCDLGMVISRTGFAKLQNKLPELAETWLEDSVPGISVHGLLCGALALSEMFINLNAMRGHYYLPNGVREASLIQGMPEDAWLNSGHVLEHHGNPLLVHACMKTRLDLPSVPTNLYFKWMAGRMASFQSLKTIAMMPADTLHYAELWLAEAQGVETTLMSAGVSCPVEAYWQDYGAMQRAAKAFLDTGKLPPPLNKGGGFFGQVSGMRDLFRKASGGLANKPKLGRRRGCPVPGLFRGLGTEQQRGDNSAGADGTVMILQIRTTKHRFLLSGL